MYFYTSMGCLKLTYDYKGRALEVNPIFFTDAVEKNDIGSKKCLNSSTYGFQGQEKDDEWTGTSGTTYDYGFRIYDARIAKFLSVDPLTKSYPWYTPYQFAGNTPIQATDLDGLEEHHYTYDLEKGSGKRVFTYHHTRYYKESYFGKKELIPAGESWVVLHYDGETWKHNTKEEMIQKRTSGMSSERKLAFLVGTGMDIGSRGTSGRKFDEAYLKGLKKYYQRNTSGAQEPPNNLPGQQYKMLPYGILSEYDVIIGSFSIKENAEKFKNKKSELYNDIKIIEDNESGNYRVSIGEFSDKQKALNLLNDIEDEAWILNSSTEAPPIKTTGESSYQHEKKQKK